jgi:hypothetical protein
MASSIPDPVGGAQPLRGGHVAAGGPRLRQHVRAVAISVRVTTQINITIAECQGVRRVRGKWWRDIRIRDVSHVRGKRGLELAIGGFRMPRLKSTKQHIV